MYAHADLLAYTLEIAMICSNWTVKMVNIRMYNLPQSLPAHDASALPGCKHTCYHLRIDTDISHCSTFQVNTQDRLYRMGQSP